MFPREVSFRSRRSAWLCAGSLAASSFLDFSLAVIAASEDPPVFSVADFGAVPDDGLDDRAAIQAALTAAAAVGGIAQLESGTYDVAVVLSFGRNAAGGTSGTSGYHGLIVPANTTLAGHGPETTLLRFNSGGGNVLTIGNCIVNENYNFATTDYGAGSGYVLRDFQVEVQNITHAPTGNIIGIAHASGARLSNLQLGGSKYHALEINRSRGVIVEDVICRGLHPGSSTLQFDIGNMGSRSLLPSTTVLQDIVFRRCEFSGRGAETTTTGKVVELGHSGSECVLRNIAFEDCFFESLPRADSACVTPDSPAAKEISGLRFERCRFLGLQEAASVNALLQLPLQGTQLLEDVTVRDCIFEGQYSQGLVIISTSSAFNTGHQYRRNIVIEGNRFSPVLDRSVPVSGNTFRLLSVSASESVAIRENLLEVPASAAGLTLNSGLYGIHAANCRRLTVERNVFTYAHSSRASAPLGYGKHTAMALFASAMEQAAMEATVRITGNIFLYPPDGIGACLYAGTSVPTTQWAAGGPWVHGVVAGNFASGGGTAGGPWVIHHDLSEAGDIGNIADSNASRTRAMGWYLCNGAALTSLDAGSHQLARYKANLCGYATHLPALPGKSIRLHGPLTGEGLLAKSLAGYYGSIYRGTVDHESALAGVPPPSSAQPELWVVRKPLRVYHRPGNSWAAANGAEGGVAPPPFTCMDCALPMMELSADMDGDGRSTAEECAFQSDPSVPDFREYLLSAQSAAGRMVFRIQCASRRGTPLLRLQSSADLKSWTDESMSVNGQSFTAPQDGMVTETPSGFGREVLVDVPLSGSRAFWRITAGP